MLLVVGSRQLLQNMLSDMQSRKLLLDSLKGTKVVIPNLYEIFAGWPQEEVNPNYSRLTEVSAKRLERYLHIVHFLLVVVRLTLSLL
jgi:hypothetical protein